MVSALAVAEFGICCILRAGVHWLLAVFQKCELKMHLPCSKIPRADRRQVG